MSIVRPRGSVSP
ncbi:probable IDP1-isocitrate dehydrogenase (NADP+), cytosolic, partial [Sporisorium scitamineum]